MKGYWQRPQETAAVMTVDGFLRTGDIGVMEEDGYLKIVDRLKDMILVSGFNGSLASRASCSTISMAVTHR